MLGGDGVTHPSTQVQAAFSMNIGSVRMTERHLKNDPPTEGQIAEAVADIDAHIDEAFKTVPAGKTHTIIGVSGTVTTMTALAMGLTEYDHTAVDGARCTLEDAYAVDDRCLKPHMRIMASASTPSWPASMVCWTASCWITARDCLLRADVA